MSIPRMREEQTKELNGRNLQTIIKAEGRLPYYCKKTCEERTLHCPAGWMLDSILKAKSLQESSEIFTEQETRNLYNGIIVIPLLVEKSVECEFGIRIGRFPLRFDLLYLIEQVKLVQLGEVYPT